MSDLLGKMRRGIRKPPHVILARVLAMARTQTERLRLPRRARMSDSQLLEELNADNLCDLWQRLSNRPFPVWLGPFDVEEFQNLCGSAELTRLMDRAADALAHRVDLLGSGTVELGAEIDWHTDFKTGHSWPPRYFADIEYNNPDRPSDVKVPWELSRLQWLIPAGQAYLITGDESYARCVRDVLEQWIEANPCGASVNWSCTMEAALRTFTWIWFFKVFNSALSWRDASFRFRFIRALFLHVEFTDRHIERSDINGNHYTADAAALVLGGLFFAQGKGPIRWQAEGWRILVEEIQRQVFPDGVDFEASVPYHRLVTELFFWPALYRRMTGLPANLGYDDRLAAMARFALAYSRSNGTVPLWGDADDARVLPFGMQSINDHRYLPGLVGAYVNDPEIYGDAGLSLAEVYWVYGPSVARRIRVHTPLERRPQSFPHGGFYIMQGAVDHVFIDCGPLGLAGRGGHGHNDCLSFEAVLDGVSIVTDCGAYVYTANFAARNLFRSTDLHNTPRIDAQEINRFIRPDYLWNMHNDAMPQIIHWSDDPVVPVFCGQHTGYDRLQYPVTPRRAICLDTKRHGLLVADRIFGRGQHNVEIPLHLSPGLGVKEMDGGFELFTQDRNFGVSWTGTPGWQVTVEETQVSPSYGRVVRSSRLVWRQLAVFLPITLNVKIAPIGSDFNDAVRLAEIETFLSAR